MRVEGGDRVWEEPAVAHEAERWSRLFQAAGVGQHEPIVIEGLGHPGAIFAILGARSAGASPAVLHPALTDAEAQALVRRIGPRLIVAGPHRRWATRGSMVQASWDSPSRLALEGRPPRIATEFLLFTSGSEGEPKGVLLTAAGFRALNRAARERLAPTGFDRWLLSLSPAHVGGLALLLRAQEEPGTTLVCPPPDWTHDVAGVAERLRISHLSIVPTLLRRWVEASAAPEHLRLVLVGGALCPPALAERAVARGFPLRLTYGLTEAHSQVSTSLPGSPAGSVGTPLAGVEVKLEPKTARILVRGPTRFHGYLGGPALAPRTWFRTGDIGRMDRARNLFVTGRADDVLITGGENVDPAEVEAALEEVPGVAAACVVGQPDPEWGTRLVALLVAGDGRPRESALRAHLERRLAPFKVPKRFVFVEGLPHTPTGKLRRTAARRLLDRPDVGVDDAAR